jgi:hypothetical protein
VEELRNGDEFFKGNITVYLPRIKVFSDGGFTLYLATSYTPHINLTQLDWAQEKSAQNTRTRLLTLTVGHPL